MFMILKMISYIKFNHAKFRKRIKIRFLYTLYRDCLGITYCK